MGVMRCGAQPALPEDVLEKREDKKKALDKEAVDVQKQVVTELESQIVSGQDESEKDEEIVVKGDEKLDNKKVEKTWQEKHVLTLKKEALEKGYDGEKFDKTSLINFLEANQTTV